MDQRFFLPPPFLGGAEQVVDPVPLGLLGRGELRLARGLA